MQMESTAEEEKRGEESCYLFEQLIEGFVQVRVNVREGLAGCCVRGRE